ncbi:NfeD family protein [Gulosibacter molinativorax]|uniref:NfeD family protein n=1 Tax=Gulosibacter molinativorax TaxID=256821 RepID=A0ABT7C5J2_9MICO|nr:NfeD family protein [Gulosibacter molinativorax]MDJ1370458.1 NfeD family protein [Gulosibacter molinativorax]QUY61371.1 Putative activity regulator of membrane protease YbbK [Gulosibacter molinativorax]
MEWLREFAWLAWIGAALLLGLVEVASLDFVFVMLMVGALAASGTAFFGGTLVAQVLVFAGVSALLLMVVRPIALRKLKPAGPGELTNADAYVGRDGEVLETVTGRDGLIKVIGETWSARSYDPDKTVAVGQKIRIVRIDGATAIVEEAS